MPTQETLGLTAEIRAPRALPALKISTEKTTILGSKFDRSDQDNQKPYLRVQNAKVEKDDKSLQRVENCEQIMKDNSRRDKR